MSDLDQLDRAFEALTRDLAHTHGPGAAAAMDTARTRRRTKVGAVALAAVIAVGGGLAVPRMMSASVDGVAANGASARLDAAALEQATAGWLDGWDLEARMGGSFDRPGCDDLDATPLSTETGHTVLFIDDSSAAVRINGFPDGDEVSRSWDDQVAGISACDRLGTRQRVTVDGTTVMHWRVDLPDDGARTTDVWLARDGLRTGLLELVTPARPAPDASVRGVAEALLAGVRDGWTESGMQQTTPRPLAVGRLPEWKDVDLEGAFDGWRSPTKRAATTSPNLLCLDDHLDGSTAGTAAGGSPWGLSYRIGGYLDPAEATADVEAILEQLRTCDSSEVQLRTLPNGVHVATYDTGGPEPYNALWIAAEKDRAGLVAVERADRPLPADVPEDVAAALLQILRKPWQ